MLALPTIDAVEADVLDRVGRIARGLLADVELFHTLHEPESAPLGAGATTPGPLKAGTPADLRLRAAQLKKVTAHVRTIASRHDVPRARVHVEFAEPAGALPHRAREVRAEIVVMGAVSRTTTDRVLFGHTAEKVLDALQCDVLVIKPNGFRAPVSRRPRSRSVAAA